MTERRHRQAAPRPRSTWIVLLLLTLLIAGAGAGADSASADSQFSVSSYIGSSKLSGGTTLTGAVVWTAVPSISSSKIAKIVFSIDGTDRWREFFKPYQFNGDPNGVLDTTGLTNGSHTLSVTAYRTDGRTATKANNVTIANGSDPVSPFTVASNIADGATLSGSTVWAASPSGSDVSKVEFQIDGVLKWTELYPPYVFNGDTGVLDTKTLSNGGHVLTQVAYATDGHTATDSTPVNVSNVATQDPFTVSSSVGNGATLSGTIAWVASPSGATTSKVEFRIDGTLKWTQSATPYQYNGATGSLDTSTLSNGGHTLAVTAYATDGRTTNASSSVTVSNAPPPSTATIPHYGFALGGKSLYRSSTDRAFELDQLAAAANGHPAIVRMDSTPGNQAALDTWVPMALSRGLEPMFLMWSTTGPIDPQTAASFAAAQGAKWKGKVRLYEFANEPDLHGWSPEQYTASLKATYVALKAADPDAILIGGALWKWDQGPTPNPTGGAREWVSRMYAAGAKGYFDMLSLHLYDDPDDHGTWNLWDQAFTMSPSIRSIMNANGDQSVPIISTESGGPTFKYGETGQATIVDHDFNHIYSGQIRIGLVYTMLNDDVPGFGLLRDDRSRRPAWYTFQSRAT